MVRYSRTLKKFIIEELNVHSLKKYQSKLIRNGWRKGGRQNVLQKLKIICIIIATLTVDRTQGKKSEWKANIKKTCARHYFSCFAFFHIINV
jgi:hypothetical protein